MATCPTSRHQGRAYHEFMLASRMDMRIRRDFHQFVQKFTPVQGTILDFGAGTGIDAKTYVAWGSKVLVHEPDEENRRYLTVYCREELAKGNIVITDLAANGAADAITANFAVLNLIADPKALFAKFDHMLMPKGRVVLSLLNPYFLGDARYRWWRTNLGPLLHRGSYSVEGEDGPVYRFTPSSIAAAAQPAFRRIGRHPRGLALATHPYMFMAFQKS